LKVQADEPSHAAAVVCERETRLELNRAIAVGEGAVDIAFVPPGESTVSVDLGAIRAELYCSVIIGQSPFEVAFLVKRGCSVVIRLAVSRIDCNGAVEVF